MFAQLTYFDGPRSPELIAAGDRASVERIEPALRSDPQLSDQLVAYYILQDSDGSEVVVTIAKSEGSLRHAQEVVMATALLPGEDPALLPGPDRIEIRPVVRSFPEA